MTPEFAIGDLVIFDSSSPTLIKNSIGIIIGTEVQTGYEECLTKNKWYVAQFGTMKLIVSDQMIRKVDQDHV
tara:strand:- start:71 stop:286 length:216 start_codon:yes stop_codon:yes gene_type:complete